MGDSTTMTIEFLRARLLSERAVSRAAKERADQLDQRVAELEEQIRIVTLQRKKAERAAIEALSVLEAHGIGDLSEIVDSSSDKDECPHNGIRSTESFSEEVSIASKTQRIEIDDTLSTSDPGGSSSRVGSLSWKNWINSPDFQKKLKAKQFRQRQRRISLISTTESTPKYNMGKSCRKIKPKEVGYFLSNVTLCHNSHFPYFMYRSQIKSLCTARSATEDEGDNRASFDAQRELTGTDCLDDHPADLSVEVSASESCSLDAENKEASPGYYAGGREGNEEMERVLEQQAQLIGQYEAEEKAQREWEKNYNETSSSNLDFLDPENKRHATENTQTEKEANVVLDIVLYEEKEAESSAGGLSDAEAYTDLSLSDSPVLKTSNCTNKQTRASGKDATTRAFSNGIVAKNPSRTMNGGKTLACMNDLSSRLHNVAANDIEQELLQFAKPPKGSIISGPVSKQIPDVLYENSESRSDFRRDKYKLRPSSTERQHQLPSKTTSSNLGGVLEALQRAKMSLKLGFQKSCLLDPNSLALVPAMDYRAGTTTSDEDLLNSIPMSSATLFRLPTDAIPPLGSLGSNVGVTYPGIGYDTNDKYNRHQLMDYGLDKPMWKSYSDACNSARYSLPYSDITDGITPLSSAFGVSAPGYQHFPGRSPANETQSSSKYSLSNNMMTEKLFTGRSENSMLKQYPDANLRIPYSDFASDRMLFGDGISYPDRAESQDGIIRNDRKTFFI